MRKIIALVCVCACLNAFGQSLAKCDKSGIRTSPLCRQLTAPALQMAKVPTQAPTIHEFFKTHSPKGNMIRNRGPRRFSSDDLLGTKVVMALNYDWSFTPAGDVDIQPADVLMIGGWNANITPSATQGRVSIDNICYDIPMELVIDYANETATMRAGEVVSIRTSARRQSGSYYVDTVEKVLVANEGWLRNYRFQDIVGEVWDDGTVYFQDGWTYMTRYIVRQFSSMSAVTPMRTDSDTYLTNIFRDTYLLTPNATHSFDCNGNHFEENVYMYQYDDTTAIVWNMWGLGYRGAEAYIHPDGSMLLPVYQVGCQSDVSQYAEQLTQYDWSIAQNYVILNTNATGEPVEGDIAGTCTATQLAWTQCVLYDIIGDGNQWLFGLSFAPFLNNEVNYIGNYEFSFPGEVALRGDVDGNGSVDPADISALIDYLLNGRSINLINANCDGDGSVEPADISALINYLLNGTWSN